MNPLIVRPVRFTSRVPEMQRFLELIGLRPWLVSERGGWADLACGAGRVALHDAASAASPVVAGVTTLSFEGTGLDELAKTLKEAGVAGVSVYDEAYGRVLTCRDPEGAALAVDDAPDDMYGYRVHPDPAVPASLRVTPVKFADPTGPYASFLGLFGLRATGPVNPYYVNFASNSGTTGQVGLHYVFADTLPIVTGSGGPAVQLNFETAEPLEDIAARLSGGGFTAEIKTEDFGRELSVTDPDGQPVLVHAAAGT